MPSPVGHFIGGVAAGWLVAGAPRVASPASWRRREWRQVVLFGILGMAPDLDLILGSHREATHSIGSACLVGAVAWAVKRTMDAGASTSREGRLGVAPLIFGLACFAAYGSHVLLDWLGSDTSPPIGVMALWPLSSRYYESDLHVFLAISRRYHQEWEFAQQNAIALLRELAILIPTLAVILALRRRRSG